MASGKIERTYLERAAGVDDDLVIIAVEQSARGWIDNSKKEDRT